MEVFAQVKDVVVLLTGSIAEDNFIRNISKNLSLFPSL